MKIALTGGTGFVGRAFVAKALEEGHELNALTRRAQEARPGVTWIAGDLDDGDALARMMSEAEVVIHVAGVVNAPDGAGFERGNVTGTLNVIEAAREAGVGRFVLVSSLAAREPRLSAYGASKERAEKLVKSSALDWTIVRPPAVFGPGDREMLELFRIARWGFVPTPASGRLSLIHVADLAALLLAMAPGNDALSAGTFEPDDGTPSGWSHFELAMAIGAAVGRRPRVIGLSRTALERAARFDALLRGKRAKMTADRAAYFSHPDWVASTGAQPPRAIWRPRMETREALKATAAWYRAQGWL